MPCNRQGILRTGSPGYRWRDIFCFEDHFSIIICSFIRRKALPPGHCLIPGSACWGHWLIFDVRKGLFIRGNHASSGASLNRHVTDSHPPFHGQCLNSITCKFDNMARATGCAYFTNNSQNDILGSGRIIQLA